MKDQSADWKKLQTPAVLLLLLSFSLYLPSLFHGLFADDTIYLPLANSALRDLPLSRLYELFLRRTNPWEFLPLRDLSYWIDLSIYADEDFGLHATNLIWYGASITAFSWMLRELLLLCQQPAYEVFPFVLCGAVIFAVHPAHVEAVVWVAARKDLMSGTLILLSIASLAHALRWHFARRYLVLAMSCFLAACFSKGAAISGALMLSVLLLASWTSISPAKLYRRLGMLLALWAVTGMVFFVHAEVGAATGIRIGNHPGLYAAVERMSMILTGLLKIVLLPGAPGLYHDVYQLGAGHWLVLVLSLVAAIWSIYCLMVRPAIWAIGVCLLLVPMTTYLQLIPFSTWSLASERFVFVSVAGLALIVIDLFGRIGRPMISMMLILAFVIISGPMIWLRVDDWAYERTLLMREYERNPDFHNAIRDQVMSIMLPAGRYADAQRLVDHVERRYAKEVLRLLVDVEQAYSEERSEISEAPSKTVATSPKLCVALSSLGLALAHAEREIATEPDVSYNNLLRSAQRQLSSRYSGLAGRCN